MDLFEIPIFAYKWYNYLYALQQKELYLYVFVSKLFGLVLSTFSMWSFKMFSLCLFSVFLLFQYCTVLLYSASVEQKLFWSSMLSYRPCSFKWLCMVRMCVEMIHDQRAFMTQLSKECCTCLCISLSPKTIICCVKYCGQFNTFMLAV